MKERPAVGGRNPSSANSKDPRKNERISVAGEQSEPGTNRGPQDARTRNSAPPADEQRMTRSSSRHTLSRPAAGERGTEATRRRRRQRKPLKQHQSG